MAQSSATLSLQIPAAMKLLWRRISTPHATQATSPPLGPAEHSSSGETSHICHGHSSSAIDFCFFFFSISILQRQKHILSSLKPPIPNTEIRKP
ncbi:hypothetical protein CCACVL1_04391 [Corchorus capsularis]|uniref:Uncharacterized protein n=1 Tax=Corchorus capsularis TaxID=210143 RepID=A0A1R3JSY3_COCAP|nr:hypothetical protein CCACVL1_04391 [Corchorus capsularis]